MTTTPRYAPEHLNLSTGGTVTARQFGELAHAAHADHDELRGLLAAARKVGAEADPVDPREVSDADVAEAVEGWRSAEG